jgi:hypothetical protein
MTSTPTHTHTCPICAATGLDRSERYPRYVCPKCAARASAADGRRLCFGNLGFGGGFVASYADTGERHVDGGHCFIDGVACRAAEARFGGIVIEVLARSKV